MGKQLSGQIVIATAGTETKGPDIALVNKAVIIRAMSTNSGVVYLGGNTSATDFATTDGYELAANKEVVLESIANLNEVWFDAATNGDKLCWLML